MSNILITGTSKGLGFELAKLFMEEGHEVYGLSRSCTHLPIHRIVCDLKWMSIFPLKESIKDVKEFEYVILNAGVLGDLKKISETPIKNYMEVMNINCFVNKLLLDYLLDGFKVKTVIGISSGAALKAYFGWSPYCCSKAAFLQLLSTYAQEVGTTKFLSVAPGVFKSDMQKYINEQDPKEIPSVEKFQSLFDTMQSPKEAAIKLHNNLERLIKLDSGSYVDIRTI